MKKIMILLLLSSSISIFAMNGDDWRWREESPRVTKLKRRLKKETQGGEPRCLTQLVNLQYRSYFATKQICKLRYSDRRCKDQACYLFCEILKELNGE